jgi:hypothetical protein
MRQVFSSPRIENVDRVEALLHEAGIETHVSNRDKLRRDRLRSFSYSARPDSSSWPAVWIQQAEDLPRARELLRDAGVMGSTRPDVATEYQLRPRSEFEAPRTASHVRRVLLVLVAISALYFFAFKFLQSPSMQTPLPARAPIPVAPAADANAAPEEPTIYVLDESTQDGN